MSDTLLNLIARPEEYDPFTPQQKLATLAQTQAGTQGQNIQNQQGQLQLGLRQMQLASLAGQIPGAQGGGLAALANNGGGGQSGALGQLAGAAGAAGGPQNSLSATVSPQSGGTALPPSQGVTMAGFSMPANWAMSALSSNDPAKVYSDAWTTRMARLHQLATSAGSPQQWDQNVTQAFQEGWLSPQEYQLHLGNYAAMARVQQSLASPDAQLSYNSTTTGQGLQSDANGNPVPSAAAITAKGAIAGAEATGRNQSNLQYQPQIDEAENGPLVNRAVLTAAGTMPYEIKKAQAGPYTLDPNQTRINPAIPGDTSATGAPAPINTSSAAAPALASIQNSNVRTMAVNAALKAGLPPEAWSSWISAVHNESGWNLTQSDGAAGEIGAGQVKPSTGAMFGYTPQQLRVPQTNLEASARYFAQQWQAANGDPAGALRGYNGGNPGVMAAQPYADRAIQRAQGWTGGGAAAAAAPAAQANANAAPAASGAPPPPRLPLARVDEQFPPPGTSVTPAAASTVPAPTTPAPFNTAQIPPLGPPGGANARTSASGQQGGAVSVDSMQAARGLPAGTLVRLPDGTMQTTGASSQPVSGASGGPNPQGYRPGGPGTDIAPGTMTTPPALTAAANPPAPAPGALAGPVITPLPGGGTAVSSSLTPGMVEQQKASVAATAAQFGRDQETVGQSLTAAQAAQAQQANLIELRNKSDASQINTGSYGESRQAVQNYLATFAPQAAQDFVAKLTNGAIDPSKAGATQEFVKLALQAASSAEKANNPGGGLGITQVYQSAYPNLETQASAIKDMSNLFLVNQQRTIDHAVGQQQYLTDQQGNFTRPGGNYSSVMNYDRQFLQTNPPQVYVGAAAALNDVPYSRWSKGLTPQQQQAALGVLWRADPTAQPLGVDGKTRFHNPALNSAAAQ